jgi:cytochrome P450
MATVESPAPYPFAADRSADSAPDLPRLRSEAPLARLGTAVPGMLFGRDAPEHAWVRRLVARAFSAGTIRG